MKPGKTGTGNPVFLRKNRKIGIGKKSEPAQPYQRPLQRINEDSKTSPETHSQD